MGYSNTAAYGANEFGKSGHFFEALNDAFKCKFFRASFLHRIKDTNNR